MRNIRKSIRNYFITGLLVVIPVFGSIWFINWIFVILTNLILPHPLKEGPHTAFLRIFAFSVLILTIFFIGVLAQNIVGKKFLHLGERLLARIPFLNKVYNALKQISFAVWGSGKQVLTKVVLLEFPRKGLYSIGFITGDTVKGLHESLKEEMVNCIIPTTPNPTTGFLVIVPKKEIIYLDITVEDAIKMLLSAGSVHPEIKQVQKI